MRIWKYQLSLEKGVDQVIEMPWDATMLTVQMQRGVPCLWAAVSPDAEKRKWHFHWFGNGEDVPEYLSHSDYVGTIQTEGGEFVFHLYQCGYDDPE